MICKTCTSANLFDNTLSSSCFFDNSFTDELKQQSAVTEALSEAHPPSFNSATFKDVDVDEQGQPIGMFGLLWKDINQKDL